MAMFFIIVPILMLLNCCFCVKYVTVVGFYSSCLTDVNTTTTNTYTEPHRTSYHGIAFLYQTIVESIIQKSCEVKPCSIDRIVQYEAYDVCDRSQDLTEKLSNLLLDPRYFSSSSNLTNRVFQRNQSRIMLILSYLSLELEQLLFELVCVGKKPVTVVLSLNDNGRMLPNSCSSYYVKIHKTLQENLETLSRLLIMFDWQKVGVLHLVNSFDEEGTYSTLFKGFMRRLSTHHSHVCFYQDTLQVENKTDYSRVIRNLGSEQQPNVVILFGMPSNQTKLVRDASKNFHTKRTWVLHDVRSLVDKFSFSASTNWKILSIESDHRKWISQTIKPYAKWKDSFEKLHVDNTVLPFTVYSQIEWIKFALQLKKTHSRISVLAGFLASIFTDLNIYGLVQEGRYEVIDMINIEHISGEFLISIKNRLGSSTCQRPNCWPGWEETWGKISIQTNRKWTKEYGWTCRQCRRGSSKETFGNATCKPCPAFYKSNNKTTQCYDPYFKKFTGGFYIACVVLSFTAEVLHLFIMVVYIVYRKTPICKSIDTNLTIVHLLSSFSLIVFLHVIKRDEPNEWLCLLIPVIVGMNYCLFVGVVIIKSQKLLKAFNSKVKVTSRDRLVTKMQQLFTLVTILLISIFITIVLVVHDRPRVITERKVNVLLKLNYCSNLRHINVQLGFGMFLQFASFIVAYKGRNLPGIYNDSMTLVYASFITSLSFVVMFTIQYFQKDPLLPPEIAWLTILINIHVYIIFCNAPKICTILFRKEKNTVAYIQKKTFKAMTKISNNL